MESSEGLSLDEVAELVGVHYQTVYRWVRAGRLPAVKVQGSYVVHPDDLTNFTEDRRRPTPPPRPSKPRIERHRDSMHHALVEGDETKVRSIARHLIGNGITATELIDKVVAPPLAAIGTSWHDGRTPIHVEHRASAIVERLLGQLTPQPRGRRRGRAMVAAVSGDLHSLPTTMATLALLEDNWHVEHLGADVPPSEIEAFVTTNDVDLAVLTATLPGNSHLEEARSMLEDDLGLATIVGRPGATLSELQATARERPRS